MFGFKALLDAWRGHGLISKMFAEYEEMLANVIEMFGIAGQCFIPGADLEAARGQLRIRDKQVNKLQRGIRRQIVEHLIANPGTDVPACLVLMSIVKDAERMGDYTRDLFEAYQAAPEVACAGKYGDALRVVESDVARLMADARKALADSDEALANDVMNREDAIKAGCDRILADVINDTLNARMTAMLAISSRYLRRLTAHTANIASSVTNPVEWLDYKSKKQD